MSYLIFKSIHIISVVTWFAGLFYMPRLFVYFAEANLKNNLEKNILQSQFKIMQRRLFFGITIPSSIVVFFMGMGLIHQFMPITDHPWLLLKLIFVLGLYGYQYFLYTIFKKQQNDTSSYTPMSLRIINEISTLFLVAIVFLVVVKNVLNMVYGLVGLFALIFVLMIGIKTYKKIRQKNGEQV